MSGVISPVKCTYFKSHINDLKWSTGGGGWGGGRQDLVLFLQVSTRPLVLTHENNI